MPATRMTLTLHDSILCGTPVQEILVSHGLWHLHHLLEDGHVASFQHLHTACQELLASSFMPRKDAHLKASYLLPVSRPLGLELLQ